METEQNEIENKVTKSFLYKIWCGDYPLYKSFWGLFGFILIMSIIQTLWAKSNFAQEPNGLKFNIAIIVCYLFFIFIGLVGTWASANKYTGFVVWKYLAKLILIIWWIGFASVASNTILIMDKI